MHIGKFNIINPEDFRHMRTVVLNRQEIIMVKDEKITIKGTKIGDFVVYKGRMYYKTYRTPEHVMRKFEGAFGFDAGIIKRLVDVEEPELKKVLDDKNFALFIIIFYEGVREKRYFIVDPMEIQDKGIYAQYTKENGSYIETYGNQIFYKIKDMKIWGYDIRDYEVQEHLENVKKWDKFTGGVKK